MKKLPQHYLPFLFFFFLVLSSAPAQNYEWAIPINLPDSGQITAQTVSPLGDVYIASCRNWINSSNNFGLHGSFSQGEIVLTKVNAKGSQIWRKTFANSNARIFDMELDHNHDLIIAGGYYDSLILAPGARYAGETFASGSFMAKFDTAGNFIWAKVNPSINNLSFVSYAFELRDTVMYESGSFSGFNPSFRKLNASGDTLATLQFNHLIRHPSDIEIDANGDVYICGGGFSTGFIDTVAIPDPPGNVFYTNFVAKLDENLNGLWARSTPYITLDLSPKIELFGGQLAFLSNEYPTGFGGPHSFKLRYFDLFGNLLHTDSVTNAYSFTSGGKMGLASMENHLLLTLPQGDSLLHLKRINTSYQDSLFATIKAHTRFNYPLFGTSNFDLFFTSSFYSPIAVINAIDTIQKASGSIYYRQMLVKFNIKACPQSSSQLTIDECDHYVSPSGNYTWAQSGLYYDTLSNAAGCDSILRIQLSILHADTSVTQSGFTLISHTNGAMYQWFDCDLGMPISGATDSAFTAAMSGNYALIISQNGCRDTSRCFAITGVSIDKPIDDQMTIYPNPTHDLLIVESKSPLTTITLIDMLGREVLEMSPGGNAYQVKLDLADKVKGTYLLKVSLEGRIFIRKIILR